jgi:hypothetical protein
MELDLPAPVSCPLSLEMCLRTMQLTHSSNTPGRNRWKKWYVRQKTVTLIYPEPISEKSQFTKKSVLKDFVNLCLLGIYSQQFIFFLT